MGADTHSTHLFSQHLLEVLRAHPAGLSEFELIQILEALPDTKGGAGFKKDCLRNNLSLFQTHFFLFNTLYQLRDQLWSEKEARLDIHVLCIQLLPITQGNSQYLADHDPLREYYLDLNNLENTAEAEIDALLTQFWERFLTNDERREALAELELADPVDWRTIKSRHRQLAMQHHPDRGGDEARLQAINAAMTVLSRAHKPMAK